MTFRKKLFAIAALAVMMALVCLPALAATGGETLKNLQIAYTGECNAQARYLAFAKKADSEGYHQVASLFRAAARSEEVHARNHAAVIKKMGGKAVAKKEKPVVKSTRENLASAIKGETYERDTMYPGFARTARKERNKDALRTFTLAQAVEANHAKFYTEASKNLNAWKTKKDFYVCNACGNVVVKVDFARCPVCFEPKNEYRKVN